MGRVKMHMEPDEIAYYKWLHFGHTRRRNGKRRQNYPQWRGITLLKFPQDLILYAEVILKYKPTFLIETGTRHGGSALFFGDMMQLSGGKRVFSIDIDPNAKRRPHPLVTYFEGSSTDTEILAKIKEEIASVPDASVLVSLDSSHQTSHVYNELEAYKDIVTVGQYIVVEDGWTWHAKPYKPFDAVQMWLPKQDNFVRRDVWRKFKYAVTRDGWLQRVR